MVYKYQNSKKVLTYLTTEFYRQISFKSPKFLHNKINADLNQEQYVYNIKLYNHRSKLSIWQMEKYNNKNTQDEAKLNLQSLA